MQNFIDDQKIRTLLEAGYKHSKEDIRAIIEKAKTCVGLSLEDVAALLQFEDQELLNEMFACANHIKNTIYGDRIVMFAPLYISNYCVNGCTYCGYKQSNTIARRKLTDQEIAREALKIEAMGHKRIALEAGEDPINCDLDYVLHAMDVIYKTKSDNGAIRRINVNVAATTVENYKRLKAADIGTYILFQETYHRPTYKKYHPKGPKSNYEYHLTAMDRAMEGGIDDVGIGALFGLYDYKYELLGMMMHKEHLEEVFGVGPHTMSVPRIKKAMDVAVEAYPHAVDDEAFKRLVAIIRLAVPYTGIILSTREEASFREEVIHIGVSQISAGSKTDVGGYTDEEKMASQFQLADERPQHEIIKSLLEKGFLPSYCTACYRAGRTGDRFMQVAKSGQIHNLCQPNALLTLKEYLEDYADEDLKTLGEATIKIHIDRIPSEKMKQTTLLRLKAIEKGERDLFF
ncbi:[FeFe] hydrogenase H-cluster radical SAM maturase HydG [Petrocella sp. FN5]|uniref:[FeFe] hydrogenase H-cluster radical SAM maturase HydG n=1 Tax=Petrocella sp. FN5 TaxID=3032002 RepID=UPI0023DAE884|nr:[FeFe] hydrogenase H-cluster radical SAM maturase HydG [Petrocella sp. FN5]MDF1616454.1 [FeFe] hydrogenase H-cluster radical SAM maturase HydG [Petrocella sp. FN5]